MRIFRYYTAGVTGFLAFAVTAAMTTGYTSWLLPGIIFWSLIAMCIGSAAAWAATEPLEKHMPRRCRNVAKPIGKSHCPIITLDRGEWEHGKDNH